MRVCGIIAGVLAELLAIAGGMWLLFCPQHGALDDFVTRATGLYLIGMGLFIGPMLLIVALQNNRRPQSEPDGAKRGQQAKGSVRR